MNLSQLNALAVHVHCGELADHAEQLGLLIEDGSTPRAALREARRRLAHSVNVMTSTLATLSLLLHGEDAAAREDAAACEPLPLPRPLPPRAAPDDAARDRARAFLARDLIAGLLTETPQQPGRGANIEA